MKSELLKLSSSVSLYHAEQKMAKADRKGNMKRLFNSSGDPEALRKGSLVKLSSLTRTVPLKENVRQSCGMKREINNHKFRQRGDLPGPRY